MNALTDRERHDECGWHHVTEGQWGTPGTIHINRLLPMNALTIERGMTSVADIMSLRARDTRKKLNMFCSFLSYLTARHTRMLPPIAAITIRKKNNTGQLYVLLWYWACELLVTSVSLPLWSSNSQFIIGIWEWLSMAAGVVWINLFNRSALCITITHITLLKWCSLSSVSRWWRENSDTSCGSFQYFRCSCFYPVFLKMESRWFEVNQFANVWCFRGKIPQKLVSSIIFYK